MNDVYKKNWISECCTCMLPLSTHTHTHTNTHTHTHTYTVTIPPTPPHTHTVTLTNTQITLRGPESNSYVLASSHVAQVFGREHLPQLKDGDLVSKKSWVAKIQELQVRSSNH